jgi:delta 1-pyrroline-5-carboxylate dehydrogenase
MHPTLTATPPQQAAKYSPVRNYIGGRFASGATRLLDVLNPSDGSRLSQVPLSSVTEVDAAVRAAADAFPAWSAIPVKERVQGDITGRGSIEVWTRAKKTTTKWSSSQ